MLISIIVAMPLNRVIGRSGTIPWNLPGDLKYFKSVTLNHSIIMGRKTYESIGNPLPKRRNIVITRNTAYSAKHIEIVPNLANGLNLCEKAQEKEVMIIGGGEIYSQALPLTDKIHLTQIHATIAGDTLFPELNMADWRKVSSKFQKNINGPNYSFIILERKK